MNKNRLRSISFIKNKEGEREYALSHDVIAI